MGQIRLRVGGMNHKDCVCSCTELGMEPRFPKCHHYLSAVSFFNLYSLSVCLLNLWNSSGKEGQPNTVFSYLRKWQTFLKRFSSWSKVFSSLYFKTDNVHFYFSIHQEIREKNKIKWGKILCDIVDKDACKYINTTERIINLALLNVCA